MVQGVESGRLHKISHYTTTETGYTMLIQRSLSTHQPIHNETWTYNILAHVQILNYVRLPVEYMVVTKLDKRNATVHSVTAFAKMLVSVLVQC
jgi:hypothetical protein